MPEPSASSSPSSPTEAKPDTAQNEPTALQLAIAVGVLGSSAAFTMYTKRVPQMLRSFEQVAENQARRDPARYGPQTRRAMQKMKPKIDEDEF